MHKGLCSFLQFAAIGCFVSFQCAAADSTGIPVRGEEMLPYLKMIASFDRARPPSARPLSRQQASNLIWTAGFIAGVYQGVRVQAYRDNMDISCIDLRESANKTIALNAISYIQSFPEAKTSKPIAIIYKSITTAYPCILNPAKKVR